MEFQFLDTDELDYEHNLFELFDYDDDRLFANIEEEYLNENILLVATLS